MNDISENCITFKRILACNSIVVRTVCPADRITVLQDENGADLPGYEAFFYGRQSSERIYIEINQIALDLSQVHLIGFADSMPPEVSIAEYLKTFGYNDSEIGEIFKVYELDKVSYLPCAHLPQVPLRIVQLLATLRSPSHALILKDPFMPFSGRWREHFAALLLGLIQQRNQIIVCTNLSFVPQTWGRGNIMQYLDVGQAADEARSRYRWEQEQKEREKQREAQIQKAEISPEQKPTVQSAPIPPRTSSISEPSQFYDSLEFAYRGVYDRIFEPLKEISEFLRSYHLIIGLGCIVFLIASMGVVFSPNLALYQKKISLLASKSDLSLLKIIDALSSEAPLTQTQVPVDEKIVFEPKPEYLSKLARRRLQKAKVSPFVPLDQTSLDTLQYVLENGKSTYISCD